MTTQVWVFFFDLWINRDLSPRTHPFLPFLLVVLICGSETEVLSKGRFISLEFPYNIARGSPLLGLLFRFLYMAVGQSNLERSSAHCILDRSGIVLLIFLPLFFLCWRSPPFFLWFHFFPAKSFFHGSSRQMLSYFRSAFGHSVSPSWLWLSVPQTGVFP